MGDLASFATSVNNEVTTDFTRCHMLSGNRCQNEILQTIWNKDSNFF